MPPSLALVLTLLLIGFLLRRDMREEPRVSLAVWIPTLWLGINGSRQVSQWLEGGPVFSAQALTDGNIIDKVVYSVLIVAGLAILGQRRVRVGEMLKNNTAICLFLLYAALSVLWSDEPLTSAKRWVKSIGDPVMVLVLWSDPAPVRAVLALLKRCAYVLIPMSLLFCKYFEELGRTYDMWGKFSYTGVTSDKNMLGYLLFSFGLLFVASFFTGARSDGPERGSVRMERLVALIMLAIIAWLIPIANSKTANVSLGFGCLVILAAQFATVRRRFWTWLLVSSLLAVTAESLFSIKASILEASDRDATFTGRTGLWETVLDEPINPLIGEGYGSFWLGERLERFWAMYPTSPPIQAHNGYIEVYLNLGLIGLALIAAVLLTGLYNTRQRSALALEDGTRNDTVLAVFGLGYGVAYLFYNITEATFQGLNPLFLIFMLLAFKPDGLVDAQRTVPVEVESVDEPSTDRPAPPQQPQGVA